MRSIFAVKIESPHRALGQIFTLNNNARKINLTKTQNDRETKYVDSDRQHNSKGTYQHRRISYKFGEYEPIVDIGTAPLALDGGVAGC